MSADHQVQTKEISLRELDALVAEKVMEWERTTLFNHDLNPKFFGDPDNESVYIVTGQSDYLVRPGRLDIKQPIMAREVIGTLTIGGDLDLPHYSGDVATAWPVIERMRHLGWKFGMEEFEQNERFAAYFKNLSTRDRVWGNANTAPVAICTAALKALGALPEGTVIKE